MDQKASVSAKRQSCRQCGGEELMPILSLGEQAVSTFVPVGYADVVCAPLDLVLCGNGACSLLQLGHEAIDKDLLFRKYWYRSGTNQTMVNALRDITQKLEDMKFLKPGDSVLDIGANDGTLLRSYSEASRVERLGFEPAENLARETTQQFPHLTILNAFFTYAAFAEKFGTEKRVKAVTSIAMFYAVDDPSRFVGDVAKLLDKDGGVWIIQMAYLPDMLRFLEVGNTCHEHLTYYSLASLEYVLHKNDLEVFDLELNDVNGCSFLVYVQHRGGGGVRRPIEARVLKQRQIEATQALNETKIYNEFAERVLTVKNILVKFLTEERAKGKVIHVYGASTKGNTMLQYFGLDRSVIQAAAERNKDKFGLSTVKTGIPIIPEAISRLLQPDYFLVLPWHFRDEFVRREIGYLEAGGKMIFPMPWPEIVSACTTTRLL